MKQTIIQQIRNGEEQVFFELYQNYRNTFIKTAIHRFNCTKEEAKDAFQDALCVFHQNIMSGRLQELTVTVERYLWKIGGYQLISLKKRQKMGREIIHQLSVQLSSTTESAHSHHKQALLFQLIQQLRPKDQKLLTLRYYHNYCMEAIASELGYQNCQVVRNRKRKIIQKLLEGLKDRQQQSRKTKKEISSTLAQNTSSQLSNSSV